MQFSDSSMPYFDTEFCRKNPGQVASHVKRIQFLRIFMGLECSKIIEDEQSG